MYSLISGQQAKEKYRKSKIHSTELKKINMKTWYNFEKAGRPDIFYVHTYHLKTLLNRTEVPEYEIMTGSTSSSSPLEVLYSKTHSINVANTENQLYTLVRIDLVISRGNSALFFSHIGIHTHSSNSYVITKTLLWQNM